MFKQIIIYSTFPAGRICASSGVMASVPEEEQHKALSRHLSCDWGDVNNADRKRNAMALRFGDRLVSSYRTENGIRFFIITEADRSSTTLILPEEY